METAVLLGLVTHRRSRFAEAAGPHGALQRIHESLAEFGLPSRIVIHDADHHTEALVPLTSAEVKASIDAELEIESRWRRYVTPGTSQGALRILMGARRAYRRMRLAPPWRKSLLATAAGSAMLRRLVNIELAHMHLLQQARNEHFAWALVVEDDAALDDARAFAEGLASLVRDHTHDSEPAYVNVSRSFSGERLNLGAHLTARGSWNVTTQTMASDIPLTNTVCAVLYRGAFLDLLVPTMEAIPLSPVLPIDWKLNAALLTLTESGAIGAGDCWFLEPAPIVQGSMHR